MLTAIVYLYYHDPSERPRLLEEFLPGSSPPTEEEKSRALALADSKVRDDADILSQNSRPFTEPHETKGATSRPFAIWVIAIGLVFSAFDLLYGISPDLSKLSSSSDPLLYIMVLFILLCFVGAIGTLLQKTWGYVLAGLVSLGFIIGANGLNTWIPTLSNPNDFSTFIVADTIVPVLALVASLTILCFANRKKGLNRKTYLASARSFGGVLTVIILVLLVAGAVIGEYFPRSGGSAVSPITVSIVNGAFNPSNPHFAPSTFRSVIGVNNTVIWTNNDYSIHTITSDSNLFNSGLLNKGDSWTYTLTAPGTYGYHCAIHPFMTGTLTVLPKS